MLASVFRNALANSAATLTRLIVGFFFTPILIRLLGVDAYGVWSLVSVFSLSGYLTLLTLGIQGTLIRDLARMVALKDVVGFRRLMSAALVVYVAAGVVGALVLALLAEGAASLFNIPPHLAETARVLFMLLAVQTLVDFPALALDGVIEAYQRYRVRALVESGRFAIFAVLSVAFLSAGADVTVLGVLALLLAAASFLFVFAILRAGHPETVRAARPGLGAIARLVRDSASLFVIRLNAVIFQQMDRTILARVLTTTAITHYDVAARIYGFALIPQSLPASVVLPTASQKAALGDGAELRRLFLATTRLTSVIATPIAVGLFVLAEPFVRTWIGPDFARDATFARLFLVIAMFWTFTHVGYNVMIAMDRLHPLATISVSTTLVNLVLSVVLTIQIGIAGVILGTLIGNAIAAVLYLRLFLRTLELPFVDFAREVVARSALPSLVAAVPLWITVTIWVPSALPQVAVYFAGYVGLSGALYLLRGADLAERAAVLALARRAVRRGPGLQP